jgi:ribosome maturation factor RimP
MNHTEEEEIKAGVGQVGQVEHLIDLVDLPRIRATVAPVLSAQGVLLWDLEWVTDRSGWVLRITIEREGAAGQVADQTGGITLEDCVEVSRGASALLDAEDFIPQHYHLEVSSPGIDRPLRTEAELVRFTGQTAKVKLRRPAPDGQRVLRGVIDAAQAGQVAMIVDGKRIEVPYADVAEANLVFELAAQPKKKHVRGGASRESARKNAPKSPARSS